MSIDLLQIQNVLQRYGVLINFTGRFTQAIIEELGDAVKKYLEDNSTSHSDTHNVFAVFIEQTQNIRNYTIKQSAAPDGERIANSGIITIGRSDEGYFVASGNLIYNQDITALAAKLDELAGLDKVALKKKYKEEMKKVLPPDALGAGLGIIDMARRAKQPVKHAFVKIDDAVSFFTLVVYA
ncbi:MAG TPA: SiaB family protein kinase [Patescibacteria group bacterium]|nr:SiaB family protein kinase [Patescibacteria group bacterium]